MEEKNKSTGKGGRDDDDESSSSDETEDEEGFLATEDLDAQISATLRAIRNKDPRVYDEKTTFYDNAEKDATAQPLEKKEKPVFLKDYHREKFMRGDVGASDDEEETPTTYQQEQDALKKTFLSEINAAELDKDSDDDDDGFMKRKKPVETGSNGVHPSRASAVKASELDVANADKNPETFLSNFMSSRAWLPDEGSKWEAFESDDGDDDGRAEEFEQAYNLRFEDPEKSKEVLKSYARDVTAARSVRREDKTGRKRQRELEREKKEAEKEERREKKARMRKLKLEETEQKLRKVRQAAGATGKDLTDEEWLAFLEDAWENDAWEEEMKKRFGDDYYALNEGGASSDEEESSRKRKHPKKPKWDDDINIKDIVPGFENEDAEPDIALSDVEVAQDAAEEDEDEDAPPSKKLKSSDHKRTRIETQKKARQERSTLETFVDSKMQLTDHDLLQGGSASEGAGHFRYRETSPQAFGMTARDILLAPSDQVLNDFAGLKKLATFRDPEKKRRDKKFLGKKARLRQWRRDVYGTEFERTGPTFGFEAVAGGDAGEIAEAPRHQRKSDKKEGSSHSAGGEEGNVVGDVGSERKKRKRSKGSKGVKADAA